MKTNRILIAVTTLIAFGGALQIRGDDSLLPPRAKELFGHSTMQPSGTVDSRAVNSERTGPAAKFPTTRDRYVTATSADDPNLLERPIYTGKNPARELRGREFELAPMGKGKACEPGCTKPCCAKK